jgi:hypothetical protein
MTFGAPETEALHEGIALIEPRDPRVGGSLVPLSSTATGEPIEIPRSLWGRWKSPMTTGLKTPWIKRQSNPKQINISDNQ